MVIHKRITLEEFNSLSQYNHLDDAVFYENSFGIGFLGDFKKFTYILNEDLIKEFTSKLKIKSIKEELKDKWIKEKKQKLSELFAPKEIIQIIAKEKIAYVRSYHYYTNLIALSNVSRKLYYKLDKYSPKKEDYLEFPQDLIRCLQY